LLSADLGAEYAWRLQTLLSGSVRVRHFADACRVAQSDPRAWDAFSQVVLKNSWRFTSVTLLTSVGEQWAAAGVLGDSMGTPTRIVSDTEEFDRCLRQAAPSASLKLVHEAAGNPAIRRGARS
jgi:hypothetical protein